MEPSRMEWGDIRVFLQVARAGQMASASRSLALDHSTISRRIARLEENMGVALFHRVGRRLSLTKEGAKLLCAAERLESIMIRDVLSLGEGSQGICGRVRIGTSEGFGAHYLAPRIPKLIDTFPGLEVEVVALPKAYSLAMREVDLLITMDRPATGDIIFKELSSYSLAVYASAGYFRTKERPNSIGDLRNHCWCGYIDELLFTSELDMLKFGDIVINPLCRTTSVTAQLQAVKSGSAIAMLPRYMGDLQPGFEIVLPKDIDLERTYWIAVHHDLANSPRVRAVMQEVERWVHEDRALFLPNRHR
jgi:DNA-binding transcriptional LysR family regulator